MTELNFLNEAIDKAGNASKLARACFVSPQAVYGWKVRGKVPADKCKAIEKATGVSRKKLRPDIFK